MAVAVSSSFIAFFHSFVLFEWQGKTLIPSLSEQSRFSKNITQNYTPTDDYF
jgi:hypothetical protein